jgi:3-oxoacyl-[acyl-carrier-protein] synthase II
MTRKTKVKVVVTGVGCVTPFGTGLEKLVTGIRNGDTTFATVKRFDGSKYGIDSASEIAETPETASYQGSRPSRILQTAAAEAVADSAINSDLFRNRTAVVLGTTLGSDEISTALWQQTNGHPIDLESVMRSMCECGGRAIVDRWQIDGPSLAVVTACAAGTNAIGLGLDLIRAGRVDRVIAGGLDTLTELIYGGFASIGALGEQCRPFATDQERHGTVLGENAAVLILESESAAKDRGARVYAEVLGYGLANDAHHMTAPAATGDGAIHAMRRCLEDAGLVPGDIDYVNAHGTGTALNDPVEAEALWKIFGDRLPNIPISSLKSQIGHGLSSAGAIESIATVLALYQGFVPPTAHTASSLDARLDFVQNGSPDEAISTALSNSFAFGGHGASIAFAAYAGRSGRWTDC